jgi:hypothetical protein
MSNVSEDLAYVRRIIEDAQSALAADAAPLLAWGILSLIGVLLVYLVPPLDSIWLWVGLIGVAWLYTGARAFRRGRTAEATAFSQRILARLWFGVFTAMTIIGFVGGFTASLAPTVITPVFAALFGVGSLMSAALLGARHLDFLAVGWWIGSIVLFVVTPPWRLAFFGLLLAVLLILPTWLVHRMRPEK